MTLDDGTWRDPSGSARWAAAQTPSRLTGMPQLLYSYTRRAKVHRLAAGFSAHRFFLSGMHGIKCILGIIKEFDTLFQHHCET